MLTLNDRFQSAMKVVNLLQRELIKIKNQPDFLTQTKETQEDVNSAIESMKTFREKSFEWQYTDKEKQEVIDLTLDMSKKIFGLEP